MTSGSRRPARGPAATKPARHQQQARAGSGRFSCGGAAPAAARQRPDRRSPGRRARPAWRSRTRRRRAPRSRTSSSATLRRPPKNSAARRGQEQHAHARACRGVARIPSRASANSDGLARPASPARRRAEGEVASHDAPRARRSPPLASSDLLRAADHEHQRRERGSDGEADVGDRAVERGGRGQPLLVHEARAAPPAWRA